MLDSLARSQTHESPHVQLGLDLILGPKLFFVTGLVIFIAAVARPDCPDLLG